MTAEAVRRPLAAVLLALAVTLTWATPPAHADVRAGAAWRVELRYGEWSKIPPSVCGGAQPSDFEAWDAEGGRRIGDARLWHGTRPARIVGSSYRGTVVAFVWCDEAKGAVLAVHAHGTARRPPVPWPMLKVLARVQDRP